MDKKLSLLVIAGMIGILGAVFTYVTYKDLNDKKDHLRKIMINRGEAIIDSFEAASREISRNDERRKFWVQKLLIETSRLSGVKYIFISSPEGQILARSNTAGTDYNELEKFASEKNTKKNLSWEILKEENNENLLLFRKLSPSFLPDGKNWMNSHKNKDHMPEKNTRPRERVEHMRHMGTQQGPVIRFFYRNNKILQYNPKDLSIFLALDMNMIYKSGLNNKKDTIYTGIMLFTLSCAGILLLFFIQNYRSAKISLGRAKKFSSAVIEAMPTGFITTNTKGDVLSYNQAALFVFETEENLTDLPDEIKNVIIETDTEELKNKSINKEIIIQTKTSRKNLDINLSYIHAGVDEKPGILILIKDETEKNNLKKEIALNERLATVGKLAAGVAHEIRNPLSSIKGFSTCIKENPSDHDQSINISKLIIGEVERLDKVVGQLLDFSKPVALSKSDVKIKDLLNYCVHLLSTEAESENIKIENFFDSDIILNIDKDKIKQVILNIMYNSLEAAGNNGEITISGTTDNNKTIISIKDSGPGIPEETMPHIFDPYYTTKSTGTGIGLAISRNIIQAHNGKIYAETTKDNNTIFFIEFST
ncbi:MAG: ATP-binding protein [Thermodesulfobacteriota bacterium]